MYNYIVNCRGVYDFDSLKYTNKIGNKNLKKYIQQIREDLMSINTRFMSMQIH